MKILIVEDDVNLARALGKILEENGYEVDTVHNGTEGFSWAETGHYDVIVLDVMIPGKDGFSVARELRRQGVATPILLLTARDAVSDKITGLDSGADDYMTKPFSPAELMAHLRALTRRQGEVIFEQLSVGDLELDLQSHELKSHGKSIVLSTREFELAQILMTYPQQVFSKERLMDLAWGIQGNTTDNNVEAYISFLRKKIAHVESSVTLETIRKVGYRLVADPAGDQEAPCLSD